ncbi:MAG: lactate utilization protein [Deltaproteobacteria bacterium]|nr:lactate utilization protein [Deltaproteobacteria bacterium]MDH3382568.1 lactate utilization protein [Deltaproteobacteria bacterium]
MTSPDLLRRFLENAGNAAAGTHIVSDATDLCRVLSDIVPGTDPAFCPGLTDKEKAAAPALPCRAADYAGAAATVEEVYGAIAETGSLVCVSSSGRAVQAGLLPAHHVAIVSRERIFATLDDCFASFPEDPPTNITLVTGPSRTADIELTLAIGVHGPERLDIIVFLSEPCSEA